MYKVSLSKQLHFLDTYSAMKKIIAIVLLFWTMSSFANCNIKNIDANSKLDYANTVIDFLLQFNIDATLQKESSTTIDMLAAWTSPISVDI